MPTTLPYSSSSIARWTRLRWNSSRSWSSRSVTGRNGTLRASWRRSSRPFWHAPARKRSLTWIMPMTRGQVVLAEREARVAGLAGEPEVLLERPGEAQIDDVGPGDHHPPRGLLLEVQDVLDHDPLVAREVAPRDALGDDVPQLFFGVGQLVGARSGPGPGPGASGCSPC